MRFEIERKFLVANDGWRAATVERLPLRDGLIGHFSHGKVRVRIDGDRAWLTVKGPRDGFGRAEFEYAIPCPDAEAMLATVCVGGLIEKTRHRVPHAGLVWDVDVFGGILDGIILAEVELESQDQEFDRPAWVGAEVTGDVRFRQATLLHLCARAKGRITLDDILALPSIAA